MLFHPFQVCFSSRRFLFCARFSSSCVVSLVSLYARLPFFFACFFLSVIWNLIKFFCSSYLCAGCIIAICIITVVCAFVPGMVCYSCKMLLLIDMKIKFDYVSSNLKLCKQNHSITLQFWVRNRRFVLVCCQRMKLVTFCACVVVIFILIIRRDISTLAHSSIFQTVKCSRFFSFISEVYTFS